MNINRSFSQGDYYDASKTNDRERDWGYLWGADSEDYRFDSYARATVISRARRERRNNAFVDGYINAFIAGMGHSRLRSRSGKREWDIVKEAWWYDQVVPRAGWGGLTLREVEKIIWAELFLAGEAFLVFLKDGRVRLVRSELCGATPMGKPLPNERNGIIYDTDGEPAAYRFGKMNASGMVDFSDTTVIQAQYVIHIFDRDAADMGRGIPWLVSSLTIFRDIYELFRSKTKQIKDANQFFGVRHKKTVDDGLVGSGAEYEDEGPEDENSPADKVPTAPVTDQGIELRNGMLVTLEEEGEDIKLLEAKYHTTDHKDMIEFMLRAGSSPRGLPLEMWFDGIGGTSFSGSKAVKMLWAIRRRANHDFIEDKLFNRYQFWRASKAAKAGEIPSVPFAGANKLVGYGWTKDSNVDDEKEAKAAKVRIETGVSDLEAELEARGEFPDEVFDRRVKLWQQLMKSTGRDEETPAPLEFVLHGQLPDANDEAVEVDVEEIDNEQSETDPIQRD